jgi:hypothetical protein
MGIERLKVTDDERTGRFSSEDIHRAIFPEGAPERRMLDELTESIRQRVRERYDKGGSPINMGKWNL